LNGKNEKIDHAKAARSKFYCDIDPITGTIVITY